MLDAIVIETGPAPRASVILLHGLGADGHDFESLAEALDLDAVGPLRFIFPHAPRRPVTINGGMVMRAWYDIFGNELEGALPRREDVAGLRASQQAVDAVIGREIERGVPASRIVLAGFSQGCAVALLTGLRHAGRLAGLLGLSGYLPLAPLTAAETPPGNAGLPIFLAHGSADPVIPIDRAQASRDALVALGHAVEWHAYPMPHALCAQEVDDIGGWLRRVLA